MKPRPKLRRIVKWGATSLTVVLLALWVGSCWDGPMYCTGQALFGWTGGHVFAEWTSNGDPIPGAVRGWYGEFFVGTFHFDWGFYTNYKMVVSGVTMEMYDAPGWTLAVVPAIPAALLWRSDWIAHRRSLKGFCKKCNYDRHGLAADAKCPECGEPGLPQGTKA